MYFIPIGILLKDEPSVREAADMTPGQLSDLTWGDFLASNLLPVTIGNIIGGALLVGAVYWFVYLRPRRMARARDRSRPQEPAAPARRR